MSTPARIFLVATADGRSRLMAVREGEFEAWEVAEFGDPLLADFAALVLSAHEPFVDAVFAEVPF